jgi:hypothetical protein
MKRKKKNKSVTGTERLKKEERLSLAIWSRQFELRSALSYSLLLLSLPFYVLFTLSSTFGSIAARVRSESTHNIKERDVLQGKLKRMKEREEEEKRDRKATAV